MPAPRGNYTKEIMAAIQQAMSRGGPPQAQEQGDWTDWLQRVRPTPDVAREFTDPGMIALPPQVVDKRMEQVYTPDLYQGKDADQGVRRS